MRSLEHNLQITQYDEYKYSIYRAIQNLFFNCEYPVGTALQQSQNVASAYILAHFFSLADMVFLES